MVKGEFEKIKWPIWLAISLLIVASVGFFLNSDNDYDNNDYTESAESKETTSGEEYLEEYYEISHFSCGDTYGIVTMKSLGNREEQILLGLMSLYEDCPNPEKQSITIIEPTKECNYFFSGEIIKQWYIGTREDNYLIPETSKRIIEEDMYFIFWKSFGKTAYEFEIKYGASELTDIQFILSWGYKDYLENGITETALINYMIYEIKDPRNCE
jgi:hypothetical protein